MMKFFESMQYAQCLSFSIDVPMLCTGEAFTYEHYESENGIVWSAIFLACYTISDLQHGGNESCPVASVSR